MFSKAFFASKVGHAALASIAAMIAFTVIASMPQIDAASHMVVVGTPMVELA